MDWILETKLLTETPDRLTDVSSWHTHIPFAFWCIEALRPRTLVELGTHRGDSYSAFCQAVRELHAPTRCYAVDTWRGDPQAGQYGDEIYEELRSYHDPRYGSFSRLVRSTFDEAVVHFADGSIDLLHIDGYHTYEAVRHDLETWAPRLSDTAVVLLHDVNVREGTFGVWRFWEELSAQHPSFTFHHGHGLGVLVWGSVAPAPARRLVSASLEQAVEIRRLFAGLGTAVAARAPREPPGLREERERARMAQEEAKRLADELGRVQTERDHLIEADQARVEELQRLGEKNARLQGHCEQVRTEHHQLIEGYRALEEESARLRQDQQRLVEEQRRLGEENAQRQEGHLQERVTQLGGELADALERVRQLDAERGRAVERASCQEVELGELRLALERARRPRGLGRAWDSIWRRWVVRRLAASGLFDVEYYLKNTPDLGRERNAIRHYVKYGAGRGRDPHPMFDTSYYLEQHPELRHRRLNPLLHFARVGSSRGWRPHPDFTASDYLAGARGAGPSVPGKVSPAASLAEPPPLARFRPRSIGNAGPTPLPPQGPRTSVALVATHVLPFPPRAGNEYRIHRLVRWLLGAGHEVHLVVSSLPGEDPAPETIERAAAEYPNLVICQRDGTLLHRSQRPEVTAALQALGGERPRFLTPLPESPSAKLSGIEQTFCPQHTLAVLRRLAEVLNPDIALCSYVFPSRWLGALPGHPVKVIDTHDVFSTKARKVLQFGIADGLALEPAEEAALLRRADLVIAIQPEEAGELRALVPDRTVVTAGVDFAVVGGPPPPEPAVLVVASKNEMNVRGMRDLLELAWPLVRRGCSGARLRVVGPVCEALPPEAEGVEYLGRVDSLAEAYQRCRVVANPAVAGTGLKIKTLEALAHLRPIVVWPSGVDGLTPELARRCRLVHDWYQFAHALLELLDGKEAERMVDAQAELSAALSPDRVYAELRSALEQAMTTTEPRR